MVTTVHWAGCIFVVRASRLLANSPPHPGGFRHPQLKIHLALPGHRIHQRKKGTAERPRKGGGGKRWYWGGRAAEQRGLQARPPTPLRERLLHLCGRCCKCCHWRDEGGHHTRGQFRSGQRAAPGRADTGISFCSGGDPVARWGSPSDVDSLSTTTFFWPPAQG
eukprot:gene10975-biopygen21361